MGFRLGSYFVNNKLTGFISLDALKSVIFVGVFSIEALFLELLFIKFGCRIFLGEWATIRVAEVQLEFNPLYDCNKLDWLRKF